MDVVERSNRLDDRFGVPRTPQGRWHRDPRLWWVHVVVAIGLAALPMILEATISDLVHPGRATVWILYPAIVGIVAFRGGFYHAQRLQQLERKSHRPVADHATTHFSPPLK